MLKKISIFLFFLSLSLVFSGRALAQVSLSASIDPATITLEDEASITLTVSGKMNPTDPVIPKVAGLDIVQTGKSSQFQFINGNMSTSAEYTFTVIASEEGQFTIPPFSVFANGIEYKTKPLSLTVQKGQYYSRPPPSSTNPFLNQQPQTKPLPDDDFDGGSGEPFSIVTMVSKTNPKVFEQILFRFKLYANQSAQIVDLSLPDFNGFLAEEVQHEKRGQEVIHGQTYNTYEIIVALMPLKEGPINIAETKLNLRYFVNGSSPNSRNFLDQFFNDPIFNRGSKPRNKILRAPPIDLNVEPLPKPVPENFTNLVGQFAVRSELSDQSIPVGETATYTISLSGRGNIKDAILPDIQVENAKLYPDKPKTSTAKTEEGIQGSKEFTFAIVPKTAGAITIPPLTLSYFDTNKNTYQELHIDSFTLTATPSGKENTNAVASEREQKEEKGVKKDYQDLAPLYGEVEPALKTQKTQMQPGLFAVIAFGLPLIFLIAVGLSLILRMTKNPSARGLNKSQYQTLIKAIDQKQKMEPEILQALRVWLASLTNAASHSLTSDEMEKITLAHGLDRDQARALRQAVERLEASQYSFDKSGLTPDMRQNLKTLVQNIQKRLS